MFKFYNRLGHEYTVFYDRVTNICGVYNKQMESNMDFHCDLDTFQHAVMEWKSGTKIQDVMPNFSADQREFLMTGISPEEWEDLFV